MKCWVWHDFVWKYTSPIANYCLQLGTCQSCGYQETRTEHNWGDWEYESQGSNRQIRVCQRCSKQEERVEQELTESKIMQALDWSYDKAVNGVPGLDSAKEMGEDYISGTGSLHDKVNSLIRWQILKAGTSGFITGLGGILTMPATIPANIVSVIYIQIRMIAAIAYMGGHDLKDDRVRTLVYACLVGNPAKDILKDIGIVVGTKLTTQAIKNIQGKTIVAINQKVGFRLLTKFGQTGAVNLGKAVPIVGGLIGGTVDSTTTNIIGNVARDTFIKPNA